MFGYNYILSVVEALLKLSFQDDMLLTGLSGSDVVINSSEAIKINTWLYSPKYILRHKDVIGLPIVL